MKSLKDLFFEDENKFVSIEYKTTTTTDDGVELADTLNKETEEIDNIDPDDVLPGGADLKLVGEIRLYSETSSIFKERKRKIASVFRSKLKDEEITANRIKYTKIFDYYVNHLIKYYKDEHGGINCKINVSTKEELKRQLASDFVMILRNMEVIPSI